jgi:S-layer protein
MEATETLIVNGLTFTAAKDLTAAEVAVAFSNIAEGGTIGGAPSSDGLYTGTFNTAVWSSGAANGAVVTFTAQDDDETNLTFTGTATTNDAGARAPSQDQTAGTALVAADESANVVTAGAVTIEDNATAASVTTVTVDGYGAGSTIGGVNATTALTTLNLSNAAAAVDMVVADTAETLALNLEGLGTSAGDAVVTLTAAPTNLNVTSTGNNYVNLTAAATTALTVAGTGVLDADATDLTNLETVTVTGSAGVALNAGVASSLTAVDASATSGAVTVSIDGTQATYAGSTGVDTLTLSTGTALDKAIDLAAGDDTVVFDAAVTGSTAALSGGEGTDTVSMTVANAAALDATVQTFYTNFERLTLNDTFGTNDAIVDAATIDLANLGFTNYVTTTGTNQLGGAIDTLTLDNLASNGTVVLTAEGAVTVNVTDADTGSADVLNLVSNVAATDVDFGTLTAADVETVNLSANDTLEDDNSDGEVTTAEAPVEEATLVLTADEATTVNVTGSADVDLTLTGSTKVTTIDGSALTGALTVTSVNTTSATTITGGAGNDSLTGAADSDVLVGGAGNDTLTAVGELTTLTGGEGNDTFVLNTPDTVNGYATITDLSAGDVIDTVATDFSSDMVVLGDTAVFQDYANAAVNAVADGEATWFQFGGATYLVVDGGADSTSYVNGAGNDQIIKITGEVDLSTATFSTTTGDLTIA